MDFSLAQSIQSFGGRILSVPVATYTSTPANCKFNPGFNVRLYSDIVPIKFSSHQNKNRVEYKSNEEEIDLESIETDQTGDGIDANIAKSFQHPWPIKTETLEVFERSKGQKRKNSDVKEAKPKKIKHKFQFV